MTVQNTFRTWLSGSRAITIIMVIYVLVALAYNIANPVLEAYDEEAHFSNVLYIQQTGNPFGLKASPSLYEGFQPPLYYATAALLTLPFRADSIEHYMERNPFWGYYPGVPGRDNKNRFIHGPEQGFPYTDTELEIRVVRLVSTLLGLAGLWIAYRLSLNLFPKNYPLAMGAAALTAFTPTMTFVTASVTNDAPLIVISALTMLVILRLWDRAAPPKPLQWFLLGILLSAAALIKLNAMILWPVAALLAGLLARRHRSWKVFLTAGAILLGSVALFTGWWFARNLILYNDLTAFGDTPIGGVGQPPSLWHVLAAPVRVRYNYWIGFGWGNVVPPLWVYSLIDILWVLGIAGLLWRLADRVRGRTWAIPDGKLLLIVAWLALNMAALMYYATRVETITGRMNAPCAVAISMGLIAGWTRLIPARWRTALPPFVSVAAIAGCAAALFGVLLPAYTPSPRLTEAEARQQMQSPLNWQVGDDLQLMGYTLTPQLVQPGDLVSVTLYWQVLAPPEENLTTFIQLYGMQDVLAGRRDTYPGLGNDPTRYWQAGEIIADTISVPISEEVTGPQVLQVLAGMHRFEEGARLSMKDGAGNDISGRPIIGFIKLADTSPGAATSASPLDIVFTGDHVVMGYDMRPSSVKAGDALTVTLYWQAGGSLPGDYVIFLHLTTPYDMQPLAQADGPPLDGFLPTSQWARGDTFIDVHTITLPSDLPAGRYILRMGLYDPVSGARLPLADGSGDSASITEVEVSND